MTVPMNLPMNTSGIVLHARKRVETRTTKKSVFSREFHAVKTSKHTLGQKLGGLPVRHPIPHAAIKRLAKSHPKGGFFDVRGVDNPSRSAPSAELLRPPPGA